MGVRRLTAALAGILLVVAVILLWLFFGVEDAAGREWMRREVERLLLQIALVAVVGGVVKLVFSGYQAERARLDRRLEHERQQHAALVEVQTDKARRLVEVANTLRRVPVLVEAHRSAKTYGEQMRTAIDARFELHRIRHEIDIFGPADGNKAFAAWAEMRDLFRRMQDYLLALEQEFKRDYKRLSELQAAAERDRARQGEVWQEIGRLPMVADMLCLAGQPFEETRFAQELLAPYGRILVLMKTQIAETQELLAPA